MNVCWIGCGVLYDLSFFSVVMLCLCVVVVGMMYECVVCLLMSIVYVLYCLSL